MADRGREAAGTLLAAVMWGVGAFAFFIGLGFATHKVVEKTVKANSPAWRAAVASLVAMFLLVAIFALVVLGVRTLMKAPAIVRRRQAQRDVPRAS